MARGFSRLELLITMIVIGIVSAIFLERMSYYQAMVEKAEMDYTLRSIKSALRLRISTLLIQGRAQEIHALAAGNPVDFLDRKPANYLGSLTAAEAKHAAPGNWYFDKEAGLLIYLARKGPHLDAGNGTAKTMFCFRLITVSSGLSVKIDTTKESTPYVQLVPVMN